MVPSVAVLQVGRFVLVSHTDCVAVSTIVPVVSPEDPFPTSRTAVAPPLEIPTIGLFPIVLLPETKPKYAVASRLHNAIGRYNLKFSVDRNSSQEIGG